MNYKLHSSSVGFGLLLFIPMSVLWLGLMYPLSDCQHQTISSWTNYENLLEQKANCIEKQHDLFWNVIIGLGVFTIIIIILRDLFKSNPIQSQNFDKVSSNE